MSDLFDDLDFEMLGGDFEDPFENEPVAPVPPPVPGMPNAGHQPSRGRHRYDLQHVHAQTCI